MIPAAAFAMLTVVCLFAVADAEGSDDLVAALQSDDARQRIEASARLAALERVPGSATGVLIVALKDPYWAVRNNSARALAKAGPEALPALRKALNNESYYQPIYAAKAIGMMGEAAGDGDTAAQLIANVKIDSIDRERQNWAAWALSQIRCSDAKIAPEIIELYQQPQSAQISRHLAAAVAALDDASKRDLVPTAIRRLSTDPAARALLSELGEAAVAPMVEAWPKADAKTRWAMIELFGELGPRAAPAVVVLVDEVRKPRDQWFAALTAKTLAKIGPPAKDAADSLAAMLRGYDDIEAKREAAHALGRIGAATGDVIGALEEASNSSDAGVAAAAAAALEALGE
jgi:hypothetical protein